MTSGRLLKHEWKLKWLVVASSCYVALARNLWSNLGASFVALDGALCRGRVQTRTTIWNSPGIGCLPRW